VKKSDRDNIDMEMATKLLSSLHEIRGKAVGYPKWSFDKKEEDFLKCIALLNPQSYGSRIANFYSDKLGIPNSKDIDQGDKSFNGKNFEFKSSIFTSSNNQLNLVQIRPWQNVDYIFIGVDVTDLTNIHSQLFYLTKSQYELEQSLIRVSSAHGTKKATVNNETIEVAMRLNKDSEVYARWVIDYGICFDDLKTKIQNS